MIVHRTPTLERVTSFPEMSRCLCVYVLFPPHNLLFQQDIQDTVGNTKERSDLCLNNYSRRWEGASTLKEKQMLLQRLFERKAKTMSCNQGVREVLRQALFEMDFTEISRYVDRASQDHAAAGWRQESIQQLGMGASLEAASRNSEWIRWKRSDTVKHTDQFALYLIVLLI